MSQNSPAPLQNQQILYLGMFSGFSCIHNKEEGTLSNSRHNPRQASPTADMLQREKTYAKTFSNYCIISKTAVIQVWTSSFEHRWHLWLEYGQYKIHNKKTILTHFLSFYPSRTMLCNFLPP